jgi:hypothetical protein
MTLEPVEALKPGNIVTVFVGSAPGRVVSVHKTSFSGTPCYMLKLVNARGEETHWYLGEGHTCVLCST